MAKMIVIEGPAKGKTFDLTGETLFLGRSPKNDIQIIDRNVSRKHLKIFRIMNALFIEDLKSSNGTFVNGEFLKPGEGYQLGPEDIIVLGKNTKIRMEELPTGNDHLIRDIDPKRETAQKDAKQKLVEERRSRSLNQVNLISSLSELLASTPEFHGFILKMLEALLKNLPSIDRAAVFLQKEDNGEVEPFAGLARSGQSDPSLPFDEELIMSVLRENKPIFEANTAVEGVRDLAISRVTPKIKSVAVFPIASGSKTHGVLYLDGIRRPHAFREEDFSLLKTLSNYAATAITNRKTASDLFPAGAWEGPIHYPDSKHSSHEEVGRPKFRDKDRKKVGSSGLYRRRKPALISFLSTYFFLFFVSFLLVYYSPHLSGLINDQISSLSRIPPTHFLLKLPYGLILAVPFFLFGMRTILRNLMGSYEIGRDGIHLLKGGLVRKEYHLAFQSIDDLSFGQNLIEVPFRAGTLILKSDLGGELRVKGIHDVASVVDLIRSKKRTEKSQY